MSAVAFAGAHRGWEDAGHGVEGASGAHDAGPAQPRLFALPGGALDEAPVAAAPAPVAAAAPAAAPTLAAVMPPAVAPVPTLDDVLTGAFAAVSAGAATECPVCHGRLRPRWTAGAGAVGGRCQDCGTLLD